MKNLILIAMMMAFAFTNLTGIPAIKQPIIPVDEYFNPIQLQPSRNKLVLSFEYACRQNIPFNSCTGQVSWNGVVVHNIVPSNYEIIPVSLILQAKVGKNVLQFAGTGTSDYRGLTIDNVKLTKKKQPFNNLVVNGDFEEPKLTKEWIYINNIKGWQGKQIEIGKGSIYNCRWTSQVCQLDSSKNMAIKQIFQFNRFYQLPTEQTCQDNQCTCQRPTKRDYLSKQELFNYVWGFYNDGQFLGEMTFEKDGTISTYNHDNQRFWSLDNRGILSFLHKDKRISCKFIQSFRDYDGFWNLQGKFLFGTSWRHYLVQIRLK